MALLFIHHTTFRQRLPVITCLLLWSQLVYSHSLSGFQIERKHPVSFQIFAFTMAHNKRDSAAAGLPWPGHARGDTSDDTDMVIPDFSNPSDSATPGDMGTAGAYTSQPDITPFFQPGTDHEEAPAPQRFNYAQYGNDRTVHTITFKLWNPQSRTTRELFIQETRADGTTKSYDPEHFFFKLLGHQDQADRLADYWRSFYDVPLRNTSPENVRNLYTDPPALPPPTTRPLIDTFTPTDLAMGLWNKLYGEGGPFNVEGLVDESSWPATELSVDERIQLQHCLLKLGTHTSTSPSHAAPSHAASIATDDS